MTRTTGRLSRRRMLQGSGAALAAHRFMAERANAREALEIKGGSHVVFISYADTVAAMIVRAAKQAG